MKSLVLGAHLLRDDIEPVAESIPAGDLFLSAVAIPDDQSLSDRDLLLRVASVRARLLDAATFVAIRYGVTVSGPDDALGKCAPHLVRWRQLLTTNRENVELTLKVAAESNRPRPDRRDFDSGAAYLRALHESRNAASADPSFREAVERLIAPLCVAGRWIKRDATSVEFAGLLPRGRLEALTSAGAELRSAAAGTPFLLSAPWPLEVFADADHE